MSNNSQMIDTHQHLWIISEREYSWLKPEYGVIYHDFGPELIEPQLAPAGVTGTVMVQSADTYADTFYMLDVAAKHKFVKGVVGWVPLNRPDEASAALDVLVKNPVFKGVRNLIHDYPDPKWILKPEVLEGIGHLASRNLVMDFVTVNTDHMSCLPVIAEKYPNLKIVIDHLSKPGIKNKDWEPWASDMAKAAKYPNIYAKISGLNTASDPNWSFKDWIPYVDHVVSIFGSNRVMLGGDWPVILLANDYQTVWKAQQDVIAHLSQDQQDDIKYRTATKFYSL
jgi:L-fuconolactonase